MADTAYRKNSAGIIISAGEVRTYRLPRLSPGELVVHARNATIVLPPGGRMPSPPRPPGGSGQPGGGGGGMSPVHRAGSGNSPVALPLAQAKPTDPGGGSGPPQLASELTMDLLHRGQVVGSSLDSIVAQTPSEGDNTWELRVSLDPAAATTPARYEISLQYPSMLPLLPGGCPSATSSTGSTRTGTVATTCSRPWRDLDSPCRSTGRWRRTTCCKTRTRPTCRTSVSATSRSDR